MLHLFIRLRNWLAKKVRKQGIYYINGPETLATRKPTGLPASMRSTPATCWWSATCGWWSS